MNCSKVGTFLPLLVYGDLTDDEAAEVQKHLLECAGCSAKRAALVQVRRALNDMPQSEVVVDTAAIAQRAVPRSPPTRVWRKLAAATALAIAIGGLALLKLDVQVDGRQLTVRWGRLAKPQATGDVAALDERIRVLQELTHALAADVSARDRSRDVDRLSARVDALSRHVNRRFSEAERDMNALYAARFKPEAKGDRQ